jgi:autotransporter-associated beta strand protein
VANVQSGGAIFNTAGHSVSVNQALLGTTADGGLTKIGNGTLYLNGANTYTNATLVNAGALGGAGTILGPVTVSSAAKLAPGTASIGTLTISNFLTLVSGSTTAVKISMDGGATNDMVIGLSSVSYAGSLVVSNVGVSSLVAGTQFHLFNAATSTGNFSSVTILPAGTGTFNPATGVLTITSSGIFAFNPVKLSGGNLILTGTGGPANGKYTLLACTNIAMPMSAWVTNMTGTLDQSGAFSNAIPVSTSQPVQFFRVRTP